MPATPAMQGRSPCRTPGSESISLARSELSFSDRQMQVMLCMTLYTMNKDTIQKPRY